MRVLFSGKNVELWLPAGHFTVDTQNAVTCHTPFLPRVEHAKHDDSDVVVPRARQADFEALTQRWGRLSDAVVLADGTLAGVTAEKPYRVVVGEAALPLAGEAPPLRCFGDFRIEGEGMDGSSRHPRLSLGPGGVGVTFNDSGHVVVLDAAARHVVRRWRIPGAPEDTHWAIPLTGDRLLLGSKFNHRHSELRVLDAAGTVQASWPPEGEVRWGMAAPLLFGTHVLAYSDEGPHRKNLHLLTLDGFEEVDFLEPGFWPNDAAVHPDGKLFAVVGKEGLVVGEVEDGKVYFDAEANLLVRDLFDKAGVDTRIQTPHATLDGRGRRIWFEGEVELVGQSQGRAFVWDQQRAELRSDGGHVAVAALFPDGRPKKSMADFFKEDEGPRRDLADARAGIALLEEGEGLRAVAIPDGRELFRQPPLPQNAYATVLERGVFYSVEHSGGGRRETTFHWRPAQGEERQVGACGELRVGRRRGVTDGVCVAWFEQQIETEVTKEWVERGVQHRELRETGRRQEIVHLDTATGAIRRVPLEQQPRVLGILGARIFAALDGGPIVELTGQGLRELTTDEVPWFDELLVTSEALYLVEPDGFGSDGPDPSKLYRLPMAGGTPEKLAEGQIGRLSRLFAAEGNIWLQDAVSSGAQLIGDTPVQAQTAVLVIPS